MKLLSKIYNREIDGRWFLGGSHLSLVFISILFFHLPRTPLQIVFGYATGILTEFLLFKFSSKYTNKPFTDRAFSASTETAGLLVLLKSHIWWFYGFLSFLAVASKYTLKKDSNSHIFNPTNFAITLSLILLPTNWFASWADEYMVSLYPMLHVLCFGLIAVWLGRTYVVSISYFVGIVIWVLLFFPINTISKIVYAFGPEFGTIGLIFLFLMITDPKTAPKNFYHQAIYGFTIAFIHIFLRSRQLLYSRYTSLFIVTLIYYFLDKRKTVNSPIAI
jgi:hypothetical protein